jgi:hypothetical protein
MPLPTQLITNTRKNIQYFSGIRIRDPSDKVSAEIGFRPYGHRYRPDLRKMKAISRFILMHFVAADIEQLRTNVNYLLQLKRVYALVIVIYIPQCDGSTLIRNMTEGDDKVIVIFRTELQCTHHVRSVWNIFVYQLTGGNKTNCRLLNLIPTCSTTLFEILNRLCYFQCERFILSGLCQTKF